MLALLCAMVPVAVGGEATVRVSCPVKILLPDEQELCTMCEAHCAILACTRFTHEKIEAKCGQARGKWRIAAHASFDPVIYMLSRTRESNIIIHETLHLEDVTSRLESYLSEVEAREFNSELECAGVVAEISNPAQFREVMNRFRTESNEKFH